MHELLCFIWPNLRPDTIASRAPYSLWIETRIETTKGQGSKQMKNKIPGFLVHHTKQRKGYYCGRRHQVLHHYAFNKSYRGVVVPPKWNFNCKTLSVKPSRSLEEGPCMRNTRIIPYYHSINDGGSIRGKLVPTVSSVQIGKKYVGTYASFKMVINNNII